ncbi:MAG: ABC transporter ATP-binding protein [Clostridiaceae bacterium]|jgi:spermidine/putrescine transport system ATP-binding protein|nr:ABC transporter ATP-binding protein [Clostridiaceae bacterium]
MLENLDVCLRDIKKSFEGHIVVDSMNLSVKKGQFLSILGPSGCGKTTTLRMIGGFILPDEGRVFIEGADVTALPPSARNTSMVFQDYALFPHMTVYDNIGFGLKMKGVPHKEAKERILQALSMVGLEGYEKRKPGQLSGGQRQRIALARSLVLHPAVLLLDEPLGALDAQIRKQMQMELKQIQVKLGQTFVYVTHDQEEAMTMSDMVAIMHNGVLEQLGTPEQVYDSPASLFVAAFLGECTTISGICQDSNGTFISPTLGKIQGRMPAKQFTGQAVLCIRPENVVLSAAKEAMPQRDYNFTAMVAQKIFKGLNTRLRVECGKEIILADVIGKSDLKPGDPVTLSFFAQDALVLPAPA